MSDPEPPPLSMDFTSSAYLGIDNGSDSLPPWRRFTIGKPAILHTPVLSDALAQRAARLTGSDAALLGPSSLHLLLDLMFAITEVPSVLLLDEGVYPIARWAAGCAPRSEHRCYPHMDPSGLAPVVRECARRGARPVVITDGYCTLCGQSAPIAALLRLVAPAGGLVVVDDTQALGILGRSADRHRPFGTGGGGSLAYAGIRHPAVVVVASFAKAFGVPVAALCAGTGLVSRLLRDGHTRAHCSPPSNPDLLALARAMRINADGGDRRRARLATLAVRLQRRLAPGGRRLGGGLFPVQTLRVRRAEAFTLWSALARAGARAIVQRPCDGDGLLLSMLLNATHTTAQVDRLAALLTGALAVAGQRRRGHHRRRVASTSYPVQGGRMV